MPKVHCTDVTCKYLNDREMCTKPKITLAWHSIITLCDGRKEYLRCNDYEKSERAAEIERFMKEMDKFMSDMKF